MNMPLPVALKVVIEETVCAVHYTNPVVNINGKTVTIICCCTHFHTECTDLAAGFLDALDWKDWIIK